MTPKSSKGTELSVFKGKQAKLSRVILQVLEWKSPLIAYDVWRKVKSCKGFRDVDSKTAYRRMEALQQEGLISEKGTRVGKRGGDRTLYELTLMGEDALILDGRNMEKWLKKATDEQLKKFRDLFS